jgi:hypothetical protein
MKPKNKLSFDGLAPTEFEEFCHDLLEELGSDEEPNSGRY